VFSRLGQTGRVRVRRRRSKSGAANGSEGNREKENMSL